MFKNYLELNNTELEKLIEFINKNKENKLSFEEIDKQFKAEEYDFGRGVIFKVSEGNVIGRGYGKRLLETAINFLNSENVTEISLKVITKNIIAYDMYKKRGFKDSKLINEWFQID